MSQRPPDDGSTSEADEWEPRFPHEIALERLSSNRRTRFVVYNTALFLVVAAAFAIPFLAQYALASPGSSASGAMIRIAPGRLAFEALFQTVLLSPLLALVSGTVAGLRLRGSALSRGFVGTVGAIAGLVAVLALLFAIGLIGGIETAPSSDVFSLGGVHPLVMLLGVAVSGFGAASLTAWFVRS